MTSLAYDHFLVGGQSKGATNDDLEQRQAIRRMCSYIQDDAKIARHHMVSIEKVQRIREGMPKAKVRGLGTTKRGDDRSLNATGADSTDPFATNRKFNEMLFRGSEMLREAMLKALAERQTVG